MATIHGYLRYSSGNQKDGISLEIQRSAIKHFLQSQDKLRNLPYVEYADEGQSGTSIKKRPALASLRTAVCKDDVVVVYKLDRLGRNLADCTVVLAEWKSQSIEFYSTQEGGGSLTRNILLSVAEDFSEQLSNRMRHVAKNLVNQGFAANKACFGYMLRADGPRKRMVVVPEQAKTVKRIFDLRAKGNSHREIIKALNTERIPAPNGGLWHLGCICAMLKNERYLGIDYSGCRKFKKGEGLQAKRPRAEWTIHKNAHVAIVDRALWDRVRARDSNHTAQHVATPNRRSPHLLSGFCRCPECGKMLIVHQSKGRRYYGHDGRDTATELPCHSRCFIRKEILDKAIFEMIFGDIFTRFLDELTAAFREEIQRARGPESPDTLPNLVRQHDALSARIAKWIERQMDAPEDEEPVIREKLDEMKQQRNDLAIEIDQRRSSLPRAETPLEILISELKSQIQVIAEVIGGENVLQARERLAALVESITVTPQKIVEVVGRPGVVLSGTPSVHIPTGI